MATGEDADAESLGGADMHTQKSGLGDYLAQDEMDGIRICREVVSHLNWRKLGPEPKSKISTSRYTMRKICWDWYQRI